MYLILSQLDKDFLFCIYVSKKVYPIDGEMLASHFFKKFWHSLADKYIALY